MHLNWQLSISDLFEPFRGSVAQRALRDALVDNSCTLVKGLIGSGLSLRLAQSFMGSNRDVVLVCQDSEQAAYFQIDFENLLSQNKVLFFPSSFNKLYSLDTTNRYNLLQRSESLAKLQANSEPKLLVTYSRALFEKVLPQLTRKKLSIQLEVNQSIAYDFLNDTLFDQDFEHVDFTTQPGEFSTRGGIIDVYSYVYPHPVRIEFFGDVIERITAFDVKTQVSIKALDRFELLPDISQADVKTPRSSLIETLKDDCSFVFFDLDNTLETVSHWFQKAEHIYVELDSQSYKKPQEQFATKNEILEDLNGQNILLLNKSDNLNAESVVTFRQIGQPNFQKNFDLLKDYLKENHAKGVGNTIFCSTETQRKRIVEIFEAIELTGKYNVKSHPLYSGFTDLEAKCSYFTDHQIFDRYYKYKVRRPVENKDSVQLRDLNKLRVGDYVAHIDYGIGKYLGMEETDINGKRQQNIRLLYAEGDVLELSVHSSHKISRYNFREGTVPRIYRLGSKHWQNLKQKTKSKVKDLAFDLVKLYANRKRKIGNSCAPDTYLQTELEASFFFEDTPDQVKAVSDVKQDMESGQPMDRLICGDVGFGKTEVAIRAAFKAVDNGYQVAVLVPTTILAFQHYNTFRKRLENLPVKVDYLSRFRRTGDRRKILEGVESGEIDIVIGTHILANPSIRFKSLGLLIVDEEQKFGVSIKEKLQSLKSNIDVLTLTATPIPRTLQFSLMAARDISLINTPPPNRHPIESHVIRFDKKLIQDAILYEMKRNGQVFFVHHRISSIQDVKNVIQRLVPEARIAIGHGRIKGQELERILMDFLLGHYDVLISTTIIENGLDVPTANTMFINEAHQYGLSDLYQMRGRVGRSNKKAFCYFITPLHDKINSDGQKRIRAIEQFSELGQGIHVALKDLEIRGAGDILGAEQSGFINEMGFESYHKILREAVEELKDDSTLNLSKSDLNSILPETEINVQVQTDMEAFLPTDYVNVTSERVALYQRVNKIKNHAQLNEFKKEIRDRFGPWPNEFLNLMEMVRSKWLAQELGINRLSAKDGKCRAYFRYPKEDPYYGGKKFTHLLENITKVKGPITLRKSRLEGTLKLVLEISGIDDFKKLRQVFQVLM